jgi:hypothetical protein
VFCDNPCNDEVSETFGCECCDGGDEETHICKLIDDDENESKEEEGGRLVMKSIEMEFQGCLGMERNLRGLHAAQCNGLAWVHTTHNPTYDLTVFVKPGQ